MTRPDAEQIDHDERLGEAVEEYLELAEAGPPPDVEEFAARYPDLAENLIEALEGLSLVRGLVGSPGGSGAQRLEAGRRLAGYRIVGELGAGGMGVVYEAVHVDLDRPVALKVLDARATRDGNGLRRFLNEAKTAAALHHTHIVPVFDVGHVGGLCYYAMQRIEGSGLDRVLKTLRRDRSVGAGSGSARSFRGLGRSSKAPTGLEKRPEVEIETASWNGVSRSGAIRAPLADSTALEDAPPPFEPPRGSAYYRWVAEAGRQAAQALAHAHRRGVVHRDVKPSNLLVDARGTVWVADFGLARRAADPSMTHTDSLLGTPRYMSPEQARSEIVDSRTDVYSLGATLYELLTLRPPFDGRSTAELIDQITGKEPTPPRRHDSKIPRDLETIVLKALAKRPSDRYASAQELAEDLERFLNLEPVQARRISVVGRTWRMARRHPAITIVSTVAVVSVVSVATFAYLRVRQERDLAVREKSEKEKALAQKEKALIVAENATSKTKAEMRQRLLSDAELMRKVPMLNRRERGLALLRDAARMEPEPHLKAQLRNEAVAFLALRDIVPSEPLPAEHAVGLAFGADEDRLAVLREIPDESERDGNRRGPPPQRLQLDFWRVSEGIPETAPVEIGAQPDRRRGGGGRIPPMYSAHRVASVGRWTAVVWPDDHGVRLIDTNSGEIDHDVNWPDRQVVAVFGASGAEPSRLVTVERLPRSGNNGNGEPGGRGGPPPPDDWRVVLWDPDHPQTPLATLAESEPAETGAPTWPPLVTVAPDGKTIATGWLFSSAITLWSAADGTPRPAATPPGPMPTRNDRDGEANGQESTGTTPREDMARIDTKTAVTAIALGPYNLLAAAGGGAVRLWEDKSGTPLAILATQQGWVRNLRFNPDGSLLAVSGDGAGVELWDPGANALVAALPTEERVEDLSFSPRGTRLVAAQRDEGAAVWEIVEPAVRERFSGFSSPPWSLSFSASGTLAAAFRGGFDPAWFWDTAKCSSAARARSDFKPSFLLFNDNETLVTFGESMSFSDGPDWNWPRVRITLPETHVPWAGQTNLPIDVASRSTDGRTIVMFRFNELFLWRANEPDRLRPLLPPPRNDPGWPGRGRVYMALSPDGKRMYSVIRDFHVWELPESGRWGVRARRIDWRLPTRDVTCLALSADGHTLALGEHRTGKVRLVDTSRGTVIDALPEADEGEGGIHALAFSPDGRTLAVGTQLGPVRLWRLDEGGRPLHQRSITLPGHRGTVVTLTFSPDGRWLATGGDDKTVQAWDLQRLEADLDQLDLGW